MPTILTWSGCRLSAISLLLQAHSWRLDTADDRALQGRFSK